MAQECEAATGAGSWEQQVIFGRRLGFSRLNAATATLKLLFWLAFIPVPAASRDEKRTGAVSAGPFVEPSSIQKS